MTQLAPAPASSHTVSARVDAGWGRPAPGDLHRVGPLRPAGHHGGLRIPDVERRAGRPNLFDTRPWPPGQPDGEAPLAQLAGQVHHVRPPLGGRSKGEAVGAVLRLAQAVTRAQTGDDAPRGQVLEGVELPQQDVVGHQSHPGHQRPEEGAAAPARRSVDSGGKGGQHGKRRQRRTLGLPQGPEVVVAEHAVHPGGERPVSRLERVVGSLAEDGQDDAGADHPCPVPHNPP